MVAVLAPLASMPASATGAPICSLCDTEIEGEYERYDEVGLTICARCAESTACNTCGLPMAGPLLGEAGSCSLCVSNAPRCAACGRAILGTYWTIEGAYGRYCARCRDEANACAACGAPVFDGTYREGRFFCTSCSRSLVEERAHYEHLYFEMLERARERLGLRLDHPPELVVESSSRLRGSMEGAPEGLCGLYQRDADGKATIRILSHLTEMRASAVLAHELAHAWQTQNCPDDQGIRIREGFAEWVAWKLLEGVDRAEREREIIRRRTDDYGHGFRTFADLESRQGVKGAIWYARVARSGP